MCLTPSVIVKPDSVAVTPVLTVNTVNMLSPSIVTPALGPVIEIGVAPLNVSVPLVSVIVCDVANTVGSKVIFTSENRPVPNKAFKAVSTLAGS